MMKPRISVIMGIYNCAQTLPEALDSLLNQTYKDFKIVLCDDGSKDDTYQVAKSYADKYDNILLIKNPKNMGLNYTLNHCLEYADTEYVARMDGDDLSLPTRFEKEIRFLDEHPDIAVVSSSMIHFDECGDFFRGGECKGLICKMDFVTRTPLNHAPCMGRTAVFKAVGGYSIDKNLLRVEDYHLWFKIFAAGYKLYMLDEKLYKMRDDQHAVARRDWRARRNEAYVKYIGYRMICLPWYYHIFCIVPIIKYFVPTSMYNWLRRK